jgi:hypothetical protein
MPHTHTHVCTHAHMSAHTHTRTRARAHAHALAHAHTHKYANTHICTRIARAGADKANNQTHRKTEQLSKSVK